MRHSLIILLLGFSLSAFPHARLRSDGVTPPRNNSAGLKSGPCGGVERTQNPTTLTAGDTITLTWEETIQHPGRFEFSISPAGETDFVRILVVEDTQNQRDDLPHQYSADFNVPDITCDECTLQMIQVMTENPERPSLYYSCADISIIAAAGEEPSEEMPEPVAAPPLPEPAPPIPEPALPSSDNEVESSTEDNCHSTDKG